MSFRKKSFDPPKKEHSKIFIWQAIVKFRCFYSGTSFFYKSVAKLRVLIDLANFSKQNLQP
jgi:hypothetical protein